MQRSFGWTLVLAMAVAAAAVCGSAAQGSLNGSTISIAFARDEPTGTAGCALSSTDIAGASPYATINWINESTTQGADSNLARDDNSVAGTTGASVTWMCDNTWSTDGTDGSFTNAFSGSDQALVNGYMDAGSQGGNSDVEITGLPADFAAGFSVVIYTFTGATGRPEFVYVNDPGQANPLYVTPLGPGGANNLLSACHGRKLCSGKG